ncbi:hypothetical protein BJV78DRAFT_1155930 [Lactifluus subvellereus]|nr:hypothetical protein BJV78DRAFT_1155930 [Lactifluus subvellereus]
MKRSSFGPTILSPPLEIRLVARIHYDEFTKYLTYLTEEIADSRSTARQKLIRLTCQQFQELSTDIYDELIRRKNDSDTDQVPFLPPRDDFHPKRNQAREKLATLPSSLFSVLTSDVHYELVRRYPEFKGEASPNNPVADCDPYASSRRKLSQDTMATVRPQQQVLRRRLNVTSDSDSTSTSNAQSVNATNGVIIISKSTTADEDIEASSGRNDDSHGSMAFGCASVPRNHSARGVGGRASIAFSEKRSAHDRMNKSTAKVANDSKGNAPRRLFNTVGSVFSQRIPDSKDREEGRWDPKLQKNGSLDFGTPSKARNGRWMPTSVFREAENNAIDPFGTNSDGERWSSANDIVLGTKGQEQEQGTGATETSGGGECSQIKMAWWAMAAASGVLPTTPTEKRDRSHPRKVDDVTTRQKGETPRVIIAMGLHGRAAPDGGLTPYTRVYPTKVRKVLFRGCMCGWGERAQVTRCLI